MTRRQQIDVTPTLDTNIYAANDRLGSVMTITGAGPAGFNAAVLESVTVIDKDAQSTPLAILFFDSLPTVASADNAALDIADAQLAKCIGHVSVVAADYVGATSGSVASKVPATAIPLTPAPTGVKETIYAVVKVVSGTPTYAAAGLTFRFCFRWDI